MHTAGDMYVKTIEEARGHYLDTCCGYLPIYTQIDLIAAKHALQRMKEYEQATNHELQHLRSAGR